MHQMVTVVDFLCLIKLFEMVFLADSKCCVMGIVKVDPS